MRSTRACALESSYKSGRCSWWLSSQHGIVETPAAVLGRMHRPLIGALFGPEALCLCTNPGPSLFCVHPPSPPTPPTSAALPVLPSVPLCLSAGGSNRTQGTSSLPLPLPPPPPPPPAIDTTAPLPPPQPAVLSEPFSAFLLRLTFNATYGAVPQAWQGREHVSTTGGGRRERSWKNRVTFGKKHAPSQTVARVQRTRPQRHNG